MIRMKKGTTTSYNLDSETRRRLAIFAVILGKTKKEVVVAAINALAEKLEKKGIINLDKDTKTILTDDFQKSIKSAKLRKRSSGNRKIYLQREIKL